MNIIFKIISLCLTMAILFSLTAFAEDLLIPVRETLEAKGYIVEWSQSRQQVDITNGGFSTYGTVGEELTLDYDTTYAPESFFDRVDAEREAYEAYSDFVTVTDLGDNATYFIGTGEKLGEVMFRYSKSTLFRHEKNKMLYTAADLKVGETVKVYFEETMTASIPPQTNAREVVFEPAKPVAERFSLSGVVMEKGEGFILAETETMGEVIFMVDDQTNIHHEMNRMRYTMADITPGMYITVYPSEAMTASIPPQTYATEIILHNSLQEENTTITTTGKVTSVTEEYFTIEKEDGSAFRFNCDDQTNLHHAMNRRLYRLSDLEEGMEVEVIHADAATFSLPPQSYAIEVIIK